MATPNALGSCQRPSVLMASPSVHEWRHLDGTTPLASQHATAVPHSGFSTRRLGVGTASTVLGHLGIPCSLRSYSPGVLPTELPTELNIPTSLLVNSRHKHKHQALDLDDAYQASRCARTPHPVTCSRLAGKWGGEVHRPLHLRGLPVPRSGSWLVLKQSCSHFYRLALPQQQPCSSSSLAHLP